MFHCGRICIYVRNQTRQRIHFSYVAVLWNCGRILYDWLLRITLRSLYYVKCIFAYYFQSIKIRPYVWYLYLFHHVRLSLNNLYNMHIRRLVHQVAAVSSNFVSWFLTYLLFNTHSNFIIELFDDGRLFLLSILT